MRTRLVKALYAAGFAKEVLGLLLSETITQLRIESRCNSEFFMRDKQVKIGRFATNRAIAVPDLGR
jgi:hypothetical protein